jgi:hypothetical protein
MLKIKELFKKIIVMYFWNINILLKIHTVKQTRDNDSFLSANKPCIQNSKSSY